MTSKAALVPPVLPIAKTRTDATMWEPYTLPAETIRAGDPSAEVHWARVSGPGEPPYFAGLWRAQPSTFDFVFELNETSHILEGRVTIDQEAGPTLELGPGDVATFPRGARTRWTIHEPLKKVFVDTP